jgi:D-methionine transport system ATP-binding protein
VNILSGKVDYLKDAPYGTLLVEIIGEEEAIRQSLAYMQSVHVKQEVLGYVG